MRIKAIIVVLVLCLLLAIALATDAQVPSIERPESASGEGQKTLLTESDTNLSNAGQSIANVLSGR